MIEKLQLITIPLDGGIIGQRAPDNEELMEKINEIIDKVNKLLGDEK